MLDPGFIKGLVLFLAYLYLSFACISRPDFFAVCKL